MYTKNKSRRITLRLSESQFDFVKSNSDILGVSPSDFLRMVINASLATNNTLAEKLGKGVSGRENDKTNINS